MLMLFVFFERTVDFFIKIAAVKGVWIGINGDGSEMNAVLWLVLLADVLVALDVPIPDFWADTLVVAFGLSLLLRLVDLAGCDDASLDRRFSSERALVSLGLSSSESQSR